jgi:3-Ketosteroid 9alpha-hydroxylase C-terminal domain
VTERNGMLMVYHDPDGRAPAFEVPELPELSDADWLPVDVRQWTVRGSWLDMNENCVDNAHFRYVHGTDAIPAVQAEIRGHIHVATSSFKMQAPGGPRDATLVTTDYGPGLQTVHIDGLVPTLMVNTATPIDAEYSDVRFAYTVETDRDPDKSARTDRHLPQVVRAVRLSSRAETTRARASRSASRSSLGIVPPTSSPGGGGWRSLPGCPSASSSSLRSSQRSGRSASGSAHEAFPSCC